MQLKSKEQESNLIRDEDELATMNTTDTTDITTEADQVNVVASRHVSNRATLGFAPWISEEIAILKQVMEEVNISMIDRYKLYTEKCVKAGVAIRTLKAFLRKYKRTLVSELKQ